MICILCIVYHILSCALQSYAGSEVAQLKSPTWAAKLGSKLDLYCQGGLPSCTLAPSWAAKAHLDAILASNLASKCPPGAPPTPQNHAPVQTRTQIQQIACCAPQVLLDSLLAALGAFLGAFSA